MTSKRRLNLNAFLHSAGHHVAAWRHRDARKDADLNFAFYKQLALTAERGKFDAVFFADNLAAPFADTDTARRASRFTAQFEPLTLLSAFAAVTTHIGLISTVSTTYNEPYHVARKFASLDQISGGRSGWNVVTSVGDLEAQNFGRPAHVDHSERYERAREFVGVVNGLWDTWDDDAFTLDQAAGLYFDPDKRRILGHRGRHFNVRGPLNVARSPQGRPVVVQAGSSESGKELAAETAEVVFTASTTNEQAIAFYRDLKGRLAKYGRQPEGLKILPGVLPIVGRSRQEADDKYDELQRLIHPRVGLALLEELLGVTDLEGLDVDGPLPELPLSNANRSRQALLVELSQSQGLTIRTLYESIAGARGHWAIRGTPTDIADALEERFVGYGADGYNVMPPLLPGGLDDFVKLVIPELQRRGLFRTEYEGTTLRENLGLRRPQPFEKAV